jgi:N-acetylmuramoyl-L-alanine amidase
MFIPIKKYSILKKCLCAHLLLVFLLIGACNLFAVQLSIVYPMESDTLRAAAFDSNYIFGQVTPPSAQLVINGIPVHVYKNGAFLAFLPISAGDFFYHCRVSAEGETAEFSRRIFVIKPAPAMSTDTLAIDPRSIEPRLDQHLQSGDRVMIAFNGTPGCRAFFRIDSGRTYPMREVEKPGEPFWGEAAFGDGRAIIPPPQAGHYTGTYFIQPGDIFTNSVVRVLLISANGDTTTAEAPGRLFLWPDNPLQMGETVLENTILRTDKGKSYYYFLPKKVRCRLTGQIGAAYRIQLSETQEAWAESYKIRRLPDGVCYPPVFVRVVRTESLSSWTRVRIFTGGRVPFRVEQNCSPQTLKVFLYGVTADTDWIRHQQTSGEIEQITWQQEEKDVYSLLIHLREKQQWGYRTDYDDNDCLYIDIKKPPQRQRRALKGVTVLLDPGHSPDSGAIGPTGLIEQQANLQLARVVATELMKKGAHVEWTRQDGVGPSLNERARLADQSSADVLLSLHHNAVPDGINPLKNRGSSVYYYHPQSYELACRIHDKLLQKLQLPDFGLYYDNLAMCRPISLPAVLIEPAFMIHPEEEMLIQSPAYRLRCARAIVDALADFFKTFRE